MDIVRVPYSLGINSDDGTDFPPFFINSGSNLTTFLSGFGIPSDTLAQIEALYHDTPNIDIPLSSPGRFNDTIGLLFKEAPP
jgi:triacylglycerol lipase